jgi:uncharacterized protein YfcZ (UPF0381/DUF406 family)
MRQKFTVQAKAVEKIVNAAAAHGVKPERLYEAVQLDPSLLLDPDNRIPFAQLVALYEKAAELTGDNDFGLHIGQSINPTAFDVVGYCALNSPTLGAAFARVARYHSIWTDGALFSLETSNETSAIIYSYADTSIHNHRQDAEMTLATVTTLCRNIASADFAPTSVEFQHDAPRDISEHVRLFRCAIEFSASANKLIFPSSFLSLPIAKADASLCALLDRHAEELLAKFPPRDSLVDHSSVLPINSVSRREHCNANFRSSVLHTTSFSTTCAASLRCAICANVKWRSAKSPTCSASLSRAPFIARSNAGLGSHRRNSGVNEAFLLCVLCAPFAAWRERSFLTQSRKEAK